MPQRPDFFVQTLKALRNGSAYDELAQRLHECVQACQNSQRKTEITLTLTIKPDKREGLYRVIDRIQAKIPEPPNEGTPLFGTPEGYLDKDDPQQSLDFGESEQSGEKPRRRSAA
jgi:hypothetical protein